MLLLRGFVQAQRDEEAHSLLQRGARGVQTRDDPAALLHGQDGHAQQGWRSRRRRQTQTRRRRQEEAGTPPARGGQGQLHRPRGRRLRGCGDCEQRGQGPDAQLQAPRVNPRRDRRRRRSQVQAPAPQERGRRGAHPG